jgi:hypothetical protein
VLSLPRREPGTPPIALKCCPHNLRIGAPRGKTPRRRGGRRLEPQSVPCCRHHLPLPSRGPCLSDASNAGASRQALTGRPRAAPRELPEGRGGRRESEVKRLLRLSHMRVVLGARGVGRGAQALCLQHRRVAMGRAFRQSLLKEYRAIYLLKLFIISITS